MPDLTPPPQGPTLLTEKRRDRGFLRSPMITPQGFLLAEGIAAVAGIHDYILKGPDGLPRLVRELIDDDVLRADAGQVGRLPLTLHHPSTDVSPANIRELGVGEVGERVSYIEDAQGGYVQVSVCTRRSDAIAEVMAGNAAELSFGYDVQIDPTPGVHPFYGRYDQRQVKRVYNHLALVDEARHGDEARLRVDRSDFNCEEDFVPFQLTPESLTALRTDSTHTSPPSGHGGSMEFLRALAAQLKIPRWDSLTEEGLKSAIQDRGESLQRVSDSVESLRPGTRSDIGAAELVADMVGQHAEKLSDMTAMMKKVEKERDGYMTERDGYMTERDNFKAELEEMKKDREAESEAEALRMQTATEDAEKARADAAEASDALTKQLGELTAANDSLTAANGTLTDQLTAEKARADAAEARVSDAAAEARAVADAAELVTMTKLAAELKVELKTADGDKKLEDLRADCAVVLLGEALPEGYSSESVKGILAPSLRRLASGESLSSDRDSRYDAFRKNEERNQPSARPSFRSRADSMHNGSK